MRSSPPLLDEAVAIRTAQVVTPRRRTDPGEAAALRAAVETDTDSADRAARAWTGLGAGLPPTRVRVVSREGWVRANLVGLRGALDPLSEKLASRTGPTLQPLTSRAIAIQLGSLLGLLSTKVLGQFVLPLGGAGQGQMVLVGPNLLELPERFGLLADDVRRTVLLHELAHRLQFDGVDWLGGHLRGLLTRYLEAAKLEPGALLDVLARLPDALRQVREEQSITPLLTAALNDEQRAIVEEAQALMSLLEGHGNATMYAAAEGYVRDPAAVRDALEERRTDLVGRLLTAVAGLDMKKRQYREGEAFVRTVVDEVGTDGLNHAFEDPAKLPSASEIARPGEWLQRVHGT